VGYHICFSGSSYVWDYFMWTRFNFERRLLVKLIYTNMKTIFKTGIKVPIEGVQFSNIEQSIEWEIEGDNADQMLEELKVKLNGWLEEQITSTGGVFKSTIQTLNAKIEKAREEYINLMKLKKGVTNEQ